MNFYVKYSEQYILLLVLTGWKCVVGGGGGGVDLYIVYLVTPSRDVYPVCSFVQDFHKDP